MAPTVAESAGSRVTAVIDLSAIEHNVRQLQQVAGAAQVMAVVKANGYGHGLVPAARAALSGGAQWLAVATASEAIVLRDAGITAPMFLLLLGAADPIDDLLRADVDLPVGSQTTLSAVVTAARTSDKPARIHLQLDSGMGRGGATVQEWPSLVRASIRAEAEGAVKVVGVWSHLASADVADDPSIALQTEAFTGAIAEAERAGLRPELRHLANSAATLTLPETHFDVVRPGLSVFGVSPIPVAASEEMFGLRPAMTLTSHVASTKRVGASQGVSYGLDYRTSSATTLGVIPVGYADVVPRSGSNRAPITIGGRRYTVAGRVSMDQLVVDLGDEPVTTGDVVTFFGPGTQGEPTVNDWAIACGTIPNEILTRIGSRVDRRYM